MKKIEKLTPASLKKEVPACQINGEYDWKTQRSTDTFKFGTYGTTSQYSPGRHFNDQDSYTD